MKMSKKASSNIETEVKIVVDRISQMAELPNPDLSYADKKEATTQSKNYGIKSGGETATIDELYPVTFDTMKNTKQSIAGVDEKWHMTIDLNNEEENTGEVVESKTDVLVT